MELISEVLVDDGTTQEVGEISMRGEAGEWPAIPVVKEFCPMQVWLGMMVIRLLMSAGCWSLVWLRGGSQAVNTPWLMAGGCTSSYSA